MDLRSVHDLAAAVRGRRRNLGLTQAALASAAGVSRKWVSDFERGKPGAEVSAVLAVFDALGLVLATDVHQQRRNDAARPPQADTPVDLDAHLAAYAAGTAHRRPTDQAPAR